jgi:2-dehydro-3-deoxy-D-arabinonate dehydratase
MKLTRYAVRDRQAWAVDGQRFGGENSLVELLAMPLAEMMVRIRETSGDVEGTLLAPCEAWQEVWAAGGTYLRSRQEREAESSVADVYARVYDAARPEIFFKASGWRVVGDGEAVRIRRDSDWNVPEPELVLVINKFGEIVGYTAGNDMSSRSIEGENPLYLPQAKTYDGACALGPAIVVAGAEDLTALPIRLRIEREGVSIFEGETSTAMMRRSFSDLVEHLFRETSFPHGVFLMTGTGIVPAYPFTLQPGDRVHITVGEIALSNTVARDSIE